MEELFEDARLLIHQNDYKGFEDFIESTPGVVNACYGRTLLHVCTCYQNRDRFYELLLRKGAYVNARNFNGETPMHCLCSKNGGLSTVKILVENGADIHVINPARMTPLTKQCRTYRGRVDIVSYLLEMGAIIATHDVEYAIVNQNDPLFMCLIKNGAKLPDNYSHDRKSFIAKKYAERYKSIQIKLAICSVKTLKRSTSKLGKLNTEIIRELCSVYL